MVRSAPVAVETGTLFFGAFTGAATILRDTTCRRRAASTSSTSARATRRRRARRWSTSRRSGVTRLHAPHQLRSERHVRPGRLRRPRRRATRTSIGEFPGSADPTNPIARFRYTRNDDTSVPAQADAARRTSRSCSASRRGTVTRRHHDDRHVRRRRPSSSRRCATGSTRTTPSRRSCKKATRLKLLLQQRVVRRSERARRTGSSRAGTVDTPSGPMPYTDGVVVSQVVPNYQSDTSDVVTTYNELIAAQRQRRRASRRSRATSRRACSSPASSRTRDRSRPSALVTTFETLPDLSLGIGATSGFSPTTTSTRTRCGARRIQADGSFKNLYFWSDGHPDPVLRVRSVAMSED